MSLQPTMPTASLEQPVPVSPNGSALPTPTRLPRAQRKNRVARFLIPAVGAMLALSAALAAACFVKAYGIVFLGRSRSAAADAAHETDGFSLAAMFILAALCFAAGVLPGAAIDFIAPVVQSLAGARLPVQASRSSTCTRTLVSANRSRRIPSLR